MTPWYALRCATRQEARAQASLTELGVTYYMPTETRWKDTPKGRSKVNRPLFPGYILAQLTDYDLYLALEADGIHGVLKMGGRPQSVPSKDVMWLAFHEGHGAFDRTLGSEAPRWKPVRGQGARVISGPYAGYVGKVVRAKGKNRVQLLVELFGWQRKINRPLSEVVAA